MGKVIIHTLMSLDGFIAKPNDDVSWGFNYGTDRMIDEIMKEIGAVVMGNRKIYYSEKGLPYGGTLKVPQFVVTHKPRDPVIIGGLTFKFVDNLERAVEQAKTAAGEKSVTILGASIDQQCLRAGLADEIMVHLAPILLGKGICLFDNLGSAEIRLERLAVVATAQITSLRFGVLK